MPTETPDNTQPDSTWTWQTGSPPGPQSIRAGKRWVYRLPVAGPGDPPICQWTSPLLKQGGHSVSPDTLTVSIDIPSDAAGVHKIHFSLAASPPLRGFVLLKALSVGAPAKKQTSQTPAQAAPPQQTVKDTVAVKPQPPPPLQDVQPPLQPKLSADIDENKPPPLPPGNYHIFAHRENLPIQQLQTQVQTHKSLLVGKFSHSKNIWPDLDLKPHFKSKDLARRCSREQARIYWRDNRIVIKNLGKADMLLPGGIDLETGGVHYWQMGEEIGFPGGLTLTLEKES